jgi:WD repeat-containing protein 70
MMAEGAELDDEEKLRSLLPLSFSGGERKLNVEAQIERTRRDIVSGGAVDVRAKQEDSDSKRPASGDSDSGSENSEEEDEFPTSHALAFHTQERAVTTVTLDKAGSRMITGSTDCTIKLHDFVSMTPSSLRAFKSVDPTASKASANSETHPVHAVEFNPNSPSQVLVITATPQARILNRDGEIVSEFQKGDMYLRDMNNTKGHVSEITAGTWHPTNWDLFVTAGTDSTLRIWDVNTKMRQKNVIVHKSRQAGSGGRSRMTAVAWGSSVERGNSLLVASALDGSLMLWNGEGPYHRPSAEVSGAHRTGSWTSGVDISSDGRLVVTRGGDDTIKMWDTRKFKQPVSSVAHSSTSEQYPTSNIQFSPNGSTVITGSEAGNLHILNPATLNPELVTPVTPDSPLITVLWHEKLNQIVTGSANARTHVLYNPKISSKGAVMVISKAPKRRHVDDDPNFTTDLSQGISGDGAVKPGTGLAEIQASNSYASRHPTMGLTASGKSRDPRRPHLPATTPFAKNQPDAGHVKTNIPLSSMRDEDPREALLKYATKASDDPIFTNAWTKTQPKTIYAELSDCEDGDTNGPENKKARI